MQATPDLQAIESQRMPAFDCVADLCLHACAQVRSTGPVNPVTRQPIKGRKFGGGIRFGEMERDALLAHGAAYLLHDRLHTCSDYTVMEVCSACGSLLSPNQYIPTATAADMPRAAPGQLNMSPLLCSTLLMMSNLYCLC